MAERTHKQKTTTLTTEPEVVEEAPPTSESGEKLKAELDDLLDEIDEVLETNAEDFVKSYVQKGGQLEAPRACRCSPRAKIRGSSFADLLRRIGASGADVDGLTLPLSRRAAPCHDVRGGALCRRGRHGRRPPGDLGQPDQPPGDGEGDRPPTATAAWPSPARPGRPWRWCALFQLQLEHYEKVEGSERSASEGKANQLSTMVRGHLPAAMQGLAVVPLFGGYDLRAGHRAPLPLRRHRRALRGARLRWRPAPAASTPAR